MFQGGESGSKLDWESSILSTSAKLLVEISIKINSALVWLYESELNEDRYYT